MISHIDIKDFAIIKDLSLDFKDGLNVITGETGAGKSVVIEAISLALGSRADTDYIRHGAEKAVISMLIDTEDNQYHIKREISQGKSVCRINGELVSLSELSALCKNLVDIHGQYDHQSLLNHDNHIGILDKYGAPDLFSVKLDVAEKYEAYADASMQLRDLRRSVSDSARQKDFLKYELDEIRAASVKPGEYEELEENIKMMENSESIYSALNKAHETLFSGDSAAYSLLGEATAALEEVKEYSADLAELLQRVNDIYYSLEDINSDLRSNKDRISFSQAELDVAIERIEVLNKLKKKYGGSLEAVISYADEAEKKLSDIENFDDMMSALEKKIFELKSAYDNAAEELTLKRKETAAKLSELVNKELAELNFTNAVFSVKFDKCTPSAEGIDVIEFLISANKGEDLKPLAKVASGGELSRIMLALKRITGDTDGISTMIFDEIDTGISGATAGVVGDKLKTIANNHQVVCITHLPQIAAKGSSHFRIEKISDEISTQATVVPLNNEQRIEELARLLSGTVITDSARAQAKELLQNDRKH